MDNRVELDGKIWKNGSKTQILEKKIQGTVSVQEMLCFSCFDHLSYFDHNVLISDPI